MQQEARGATSDPRRRRRGQRPGRAPSAERRRPVRGRRRHRPLRRPHRARRRSASTCEPGEVLGVIGPNGAGKTTLFNVVCGFSRPTTGTLRWQRRARCTGLRPHQLAGLGIARTLQGVGLFDRPDRPGERHGRRRPRTPGPASSPALLGAARAATRTSAALRERAMAMLEQLGARTYADRYPGALPYPVQKRVALARALVAEPDLLLLDEPAGGLSNDEMDELGDADPRAARAGWRVMLVEHHMDLVMSVCDRITVLDFGKVIANGTPDAGPRRPGGARGLPRRRGESAEALRTEEA